MTARYLFSFFFCHDRIKEIQTSYLGFVSPIAGGYLLFFCLFSVIHQTTIFRIIAVNGRKDTPFLLFHLYQLSNALKKCLILKMLVFKGAWSLYPTLKTFHLVGGLRMFSCIVFLIIYKTICFIICLINGGRMSYVTLLLYWSNGFF